MTGSVARRISGIVRRDAQQARKPDYVQFGRFDWEMNHIQAGGLPEIRTSRTAQTSTVSICWADLERMRWSEWKLYGENWLARNFGVLSCRRLEPVRGVCTG